MIHQNFQIVGLHVRMLRRAPEKIIRMLHDKLVERRRRRHQHRARTSAAPPRAPGALPCGRNRARISRHHGGIERADVDAQFQRVCRHHAANAPFAQAALDFAPLARQISAAIAAHRFRLPGLRGIRLLQIGEQHFRVQAAVRKHDRLQFSRQQFLRDARRLVQIAAPDAEIAIHHRRVVEDEQLFRRRRAIFFQHARLGFSINCAASSPGFAIVAEQQINCGSEP